MSKKMEKEQKVFIVKGAGNIPQAIEWHEGDTVGDILERAEVEIAQGRTTTLGQRRVRSMGTPIKPNETIIIAGKPGNGR